MNARELAAAIRKGHTMIGEVRVPWFGKTHQSERRPCGCALGAAMAGSGHAAPDDNLKYDTANIAAVLGIEPRLAFRVSHMHHAENMPRLAIADWLDTLEPAQRQTFDDFMKATMQAVEVPLDVAPAPNSCPSV